VTHAGDIAPSAVRRLADVAAWHLEADVVVVGFGCAGAAAAIEATAAGADTLILERAAGGGGTSALSGGLIYLGGGTAVQRACGYADTSEEMYKFLMAACGPGPDEAKIRLFCDESVAHFDWLVAQGVPFKASFYPEPGLEPPGDDGLVYSGGEDAYPFDRVARPAPRGHKPQANGAAGAFFMQRMVAATERTAARIALDTRTDTLVVADDGRVVGVVARRGGAELLARARRGVVLAAGGFVQNRAMVARYCPVIQRCTYKLGQDGDDGRAIRMAMGAGGAVIRMEAAEVAVPLTPPRRLMRGILVNRYGQRFINEDTYFGRVGQESLFHQGGRMWLVVDDGVYERNMVGMEPRQVEATVADLEGALGMPEGMLQSTVEYYNRHAARGADPLFHKGAALLQPLTQPPYAAIDCSVEATIYATFTLGGLHTTVDGAVLDPDGAVVPGLYAAGRTTSGVAAAGYASGLSLADGTFFGRRAGRAAAGA
jgi:succinate dehydrogenase/fumarate reductase flavoprotein subunit